MPALHIQDIFSQFQFYQHQYLDILQNPEQYYQPVENAHIYFSAFSEEKVYLGDLLQLWFGDKWTEHQVKVLDHVDHGLWEQFTECWHNSLFLFSIERKGLFAQTSAFAWSTEDQQIKQIRLNQVLPYYCHYLSLQRPKRLS